MKKALHSVCPERRANAFFGQKLTPTLFTKTEEKKKESESDLEHVPLLVSF